VNKSFQRSVLSHQLMLGKGDSTMGAVLVLTPMVVASWPAISAAVVGAAAAMGYAVKSEGATPQRETKRNTTVETEIEHSEVLADQLAHGERIVLDRDGVHIEIGQDGRGSCTVCVTGGKHSKKELKAIGEEVSGRIVQQFAYHKLMTELKQRNYAIVDEQVMQDDSIQVRVRL
jgi:hypothetical protein